MRKLKRPLLLLLLFAAIFPFTFPWQDGRPLLNWSDIRLPQMPKLELPEASELAQPGERGEEKAEGGRQAHQPLELYRWDNGDGTPQFSNEPPPPGVDYEVVQVNPDANLIQPLTPSAPPATQEEGGKAANRLPTPLTVSPEEAMQLFRDAGKIREMSQERLHQQEVLTP